MPGYSQSHTRGKQRIVQQQGAAAKVWNSSGNPTDDIGINGDFCVDTTGWTIWGPKVNDTWAGTATALKNNHVPKVSWDFTGGALLNPDYMSGVLAGAGKPGDIYLFGATEAQVALSEGYTYFWVNTDAAQPTPSGFTVSPGTWALVYGATAGSSGSGGGDGGGGGGGGDGGE